MARAPLKMVSLLIPGLIPYHNPSLSPPQTRTQLHPSFVAGQWLPRPHLPRNTSHNNILPRTMWHTIRVAWPEYSTRLSHVLILRFSTHHMFNLNLRPLRRRRLRRRNTMRDLRLPPATLHNLLGCPCPHTGFGRFDSTRHTQRLHHCQNPRGVASTCSANNSPPSPCTSSSDFPTTRFWTE